MKPLNLNSNCEAATNQIGSDIAMALRHGDLVGLSGKLGSGKSVLARAMIRHLANNPDLNVPSPSYTLCQNYEASLPVAHIDLYRIETPDEIVELGLEEALDHGCAIIEWPEKALDPLPADALLVRICDTGPGARSIEISGHGPLFERVSRSLHVRQFLKDNRYEAVDRLRYSADASVRNYELITSASADLLLMDEPQQADGPPIKNGQSYSRIAHLAENVSGFVAIDQLLLDKGFMAPQIYAEDLKQGLLLIQHLGDNGIIDDCGRPIEERYMAAMEFLARLHECDWPKAIEFRPGNLWPLPIYDCQAMLVEVELLIEWYIPARRKAALTPAQSKKFHELWLAHAQLLQYCEQSLVLRDYHSPNILWLEENSGNDRIGVIDFQDAVFGPTSYDVASLAQDARVDVDAALEKRLVDHYVAARKTNSPGFDEAAFKTSYALMAAQRATKILGIFIRLDIRDCKPAYLAHLPRIHEYLARSFRHPVLAGYKEWFETVTGSPLEDN